MLVAGPVAQVVRLRLNQPRRARPANNPVIKRLAKKLRENRNDIAAQHSAISKTTTNPTNLQADRSGSSSARISISTTIDSAIGIRCSRSLLRLQQPATRRRRFSSLRAPCQWLAPACFQLNTLQLPIVKLILRKFDAFCFGKPEIHNRPAPLPIRCCRNLQTSEPSDRFETSSSRVPTACALRSGPTPNNSRDAFKSLRKICQNIGNQLALQASAF